MSDIKLQIQFQSQISSQTPSTNPKEIKKNQQKKQSQCWYKKKMRDESQRKLIKKIARRWKWEEKKGKKRRKILVEWNFFFIVCDIFTIFCWYFFPHRRFFPFHTLKTVGKWRKFEYIRIAAFFFLSILRPWHIESREKKYSWVHRHTVSSKNVNFFSL